MEIQRYKEYIDNETLVSQGKEGKIYRVFDYAIKIFHKERKSTLPRISDEGLKKLITLPLNCFNNPIDIITDNGSIIGTIESYLDEEELTKENIAISLDDLKKDIKTLSDNGFTIEDLYYNYTCSNGKLMFFDMTSYQYINTRAPFMIDTIY